MSFGILVLCFWMMQLMMYTQGISPSYSHLFPERSLFINFIPVHKQIIYLFQAHFYLSNEWSTISVRLLAEEIQDTCCIPIIRHDFTKCANWRFFWCQPPRKQAVLLLKTAYRRPCNHFESEIHGHTQIHFVYSGSSV